MRVLHVTDFFPPVRGGLEGHVDDLSGAQAAAGHDVHVATLTPDPAPSDQRVTAHVVRAVATKLLPHADADRPFHPPLPDPRAWHELGRLVERIRPDVVHAHSWLGISVPRRVPAPIVLTVHDFGLVCQLHTLLRTDGTACPGPSLAACVPCARRRQGLVQAALLAPATAAGRWWWKVDRVITLSHHVAETLRRFVPAPIDVCGGLVVARRPVLPDGLPTSPFALFAGEPSTHKGIDVLFDAWTRLPDVPLVVAASRPLTRSVPVGVTVVHLTHEEMAGAWEAATLAVVPSVWAEPFGMVAMEALAAGTPVVASDIGALPEIVRDRVDGVLTAPGDATGLAEAVRRLLDDVAGRTAMAAAALDGPRRFAPEALVARVAAVYERVA